MPKNPLNSMEEEDVQFFILTLSSFIIALTFLVLKNKLARTKRLPPGPWKLPIIGNLHQLGDSPHKSIQRLSQKYGSMMFLQLGAVPTLVISSADAAMEIFKGHDVILSGRPTDLYVARKFSYNLSSISFAPYGEYWREIRKIAIMELLSSKRVQSFRSVREEEVAAMVNHICSSSSASINLNKLSVSLTNNVVCRVAFGKKYGGGGEGGGTSRFEGLMHETQMLLGEFLVSDYFPWMRWVNKLNGLEERVEKSFHELDKLYDEVIEDHLVPTRSESNHEEDIVDVLVRLHKDPSQLITLTNQQIKGVLTDMFLAGTDTTASAFIWTFTELIRNPPIMQQVQAEVRNVATNNGRHQIQETDLPRLNYLQLVIKESLRLHPPAPLLVPRETTEDCIVRDYKIPAKTRIIIDARSIGTDPKYWENPSEFRPERFLNRSVDFKGQHFEFLPFGVGRRGCPGIDFAVKLVQLAIANLVLEFDWELPDGMSIEDVDMEQEFGITMFKKTPLCLVPTRVGTLLV